MLLPLALTFTLLAQAPVGTPNFTVFVDAPLRDGFQDVSKDTSDTMKDIANALKGDRDLTLVTRKEDADVVIVVIGRGIGSAAYGERTRVYRNYYGGASVQSVPMVANTRWITTMLIVGSYKREFPAARANTSEYSLGDWTEDANVVVRNIHAWVTTNAETLLARRAHPAAPVDLGPVPDMPGAPPPAETVPSRDYATSALGKYVKAGQGTDFIELSAGGQYFIQVGSANSAGAYTIQGDVLTTTLPSGRSGKSTFVGNTIVEPDGTVWEKQGDAAKAPPTSLTIDQVIQMVAAKLPDDVIIASIRNSNAKFDVTPELLIKLKNAGASDAVIRAVTK